MKSSPLTIPSCSCRRVGTRRARTTCPTWNFTVAHCYKAPEILGEEENLAVLTRLPISRFVCKRKLSQNKDVETRRQVIDALREPGPYGHPELAEEMEQALEPGEN